MSLLCLFCWIILIEITHAGIYYYINTTSEHIYLSTRGIDVNDTSSLRFEVRACYDQLLRIGNGLVLSTDSYFLEIVLNHKYIGIRDNCGICPVTKTVYLQTFNCTHSKKFWLTWTQYESFKIGSGFDIYSDVILSYQPSSIFIVNFATVRSYYQTGYWTFMKDNPPIILQPFADGTTVIDVNESTPTYTEIYEILIMEPENDTITINTTTNSDVFCIRNRTLLLKQALDYESLTSYVLELSFTDGINEVYVNLTIDVVDVIDEIPVISVNYHFQIQEELPTGRELIDLYNVTDGDKDDVLTYYLMGHDNSYFHCNSSNGIITVVKRIDREETISNQIGPLIIRVVDSAGLFNDKTFNMTVVDINDNPPSCTPLVNNMSVYENGSGDIHLMTMNCTDADEAKNTNIYYSIYSPDVLLNLTRFENSVLIIDSNLVDLEYLEQEFFQLLIHVIDADDSRMVNTGTTTVNIQVVGINEYSPIFSNSNNGSLENIFIWDNTVPGSVITTVLAVDKDWGSEGTVIYNITSINIISETINTSIEYFSINETNGEISRTEILTGIVSNSIWCLLEIEAKDEAAISKRSTATVNIYIIDAKSYQPIFDMELYFLEISCDLTLGSFLGAINISNFEDSIELIFSIVQNPNDIILLVNASNGDIFLKQCPSIRPYQAVGEIIVRNSLAKERNTSAFIITKFESCQSLATKHSTCSDKTTDSLMGNNQSKFLLNEFLDKLKDIGMTILCAAETLVLLCIGLVYLIKTKNCRKRDIKPLVSSDITSTQTASNSK